MLTAAGMLPAATEVVKASGKGHDLLLMEEMHRKRLGANVELAKSSFNGIHRFLSSALSSSPSMVTSSNRSTVQSVIRPRTVSGRLLVTGDTGATGRTSGASDASSKLNLSCCHGWTVGLNSIDLTLRVKSLHLNRGTRKNGSENNPRCRVLAHMACARERFYLG